MKRNIFFWLKSYLGFSNKESRGFLFLIPFLSLLILFPSIYQIFKVKEAKEYQITYLKKLDSLRNSKVELKASPNLVFNPEDTVKIKSDTKKFDNLKRISLNDADSVTLQIVPGIGPSIAGRIIKYKNQLGGFHDSSQLGEVFGLKPEIVDAIWEYFDFEPLIFRKIEINNIEISDLAKHPYFSYSEAKVILAYKNQHGDYKSVDDLKGIIIFKPEWIHKIGPYLTF
ncbi:helix-hairpin-helix domain-containing protein [Algoriphagus sp.]|uniref:ComEA family DNA-binding protein n=1 Tax=Algoriphagus sp. TaxID=1872435 RepID=UPI0025F5700D|nr:helix-hairpin-helix domain-containing protein [Algoriphagus sp.]